MFVGGGIIFAYVIFPPILKFILRSVSFYNLFIRPIFGQTQFIIL